MTKPLSAMTEDEKRRLLEGEQQIPDEDLLDDEDLDISGQPSEWHETTKDRTQFLSSLDKKPKRNILSRLISDDDPNTLSKYPQGKKLQSKVPTAEEEYDPNYDINEPIDVSKPTKQKRDYGWLRSATRIILWILHAFFMIGILYFTYYMITLVRSPGVLAIADIGTLIIIISIQISLFSVNMFVGSVIRR
jgi:hypothetical protein